MMLSQQQWRTKVQSLVEKALGDTPVVFFHDNYSISVTHFFKVNASVTVEFFVGHEAETRFLITPPKLQSPPATEAYKLMVTLAHSVIQGMNDDICPIVLDD